MAFCSALTLENPSAVAAPLSLNLLAHRNAFGLLSEGIHPETGSVWGNIPQTYSMAGIINSAMRLSVRWEDVWCRVSS
jgi:GH15 family glucan-1,4-alpha-glucosidase